MTAAATLCARVRQCSAEQSETRGITLIRCGPTQFHVGDRQISIGALENLEVELGISIGELKCHAKAHRRITGKLVGGKITPYLLAKADRNHFEPQHGKLRKSGILDAAAACELIISRGE